MSVSMSCDDCFGACSPFLPTAPLPLPFSPISSTSRAGSSDVFLHFGYPLHPRNFPRRPVRTIIGLPHSSQSISVAIFVGFAAALAGFSPRIFATIAALFSAPSLSSGISASTCARSGPASFFIIFVLRHFGKLEHPRNGPRLLSRRIIGLPHLSHATVVWIFTFGGCGLPSLSRLMMTLQLGSPFSFFTE